MTIEGVGSYTQIGDIIISDEAKLRILNSNVTVKKAGPRANILLSQKAKLEVVNSRLTPPIDDPANLYLNAADNARVSFDNSIFYNVLNFVGAASFIIKNNSRIDSGPDIAEADGAFGIVQIISTTPGTIENSEVGSIALFYNQGESAVVEGLATGKINGFSIFQTTITNSTLLPPSKKGPFERGWSIFADESSEVTVKNSNLNKFCFQEIRNRTATVEFNGLKTERNTTLDFGAIHLQNVNVYNEWGFFPRNSNLKITSSEGVWLFPFETGNTVLKDSTMIEFDPRGYTGRLIFDNAGWNTTGEILENNNFTVTGNISIDASSPALAWDSSSVVRRIFPGNNTIEFNSGNFNTKQNITYNSNTYAVNFLTSTPLN